MSACNGDACVVERESKRERERKREGEREEGQGKRRGGRSRRSSVEKHQIASVYLLIYQFIPLLNRFLHKVTSTACFFWLSYNSLIHEKRVTCPCFLFKKNALVKHPRLWKMHFLRVVSHSQPRLLVMHSSFNLVTLECICNIFTDKSYKWNEASKWNEQRMLTPLHQTVAPFYILLLALAKCLVAERITESPSA